MCRVLLFVCCAVAWCCVFRYLGCVVVFAVCFLCVVLFVSFILFNVLFECCLYMCDVLCCVGDLLVL